MVSSECVDGVNFVVNYRMRHGKVGLQLGAKQKYYINRCEEKKSIQLTISMPVDDDVKSGEDRRELIKDITKLLDDIMKMFMPAAKRPVLLVPCPDCPMLHITLDEVCRGTTIFCSIEDGDVDLPPDYYGDLLPHRSHSPTTLQGEVLYIADIIYYNCVHFYRSCQKVGSVH